MKSFKQPRVTRLRRALLAATLAIPMLPYAAGDHAPGVHGNGHGSGMTDLKQMENMHGGEGHAHNTWPQPPEPYRSMSSRIWGDHQAIERGEQLYAENCQVCHGSDGRGAGVAASGLEHKPANLTRHLHSRYDDNDGYLFWRVSKGGTVEPFKSQNSAMPAFEETLTEQQRWDILAYVHEVYHSGFVEDAAAREASPPDQEQTRHSMQASEHGSGTSIHDQN